MGGGGLKASLEALQDKVLPLRYKFKDVIGKSTKYTNREEQYIKAIMDRNPKGNVNLSSRYNGLGVYPTFAQANIVTGIKSKTIGTVTFSGENSKQRFVLKENDEIRVKELGGYENLRLMGFQKKDFNRLNKIGLSTRAISALAGNSIVVQQLEEIFKVLLEVF